MPANHRADRPADVHQYRDAGIYILGAGFHDYSGHDLLSSSLRDTIQGGSQINPGPISGRNQLEIRRIDGLGRYIQY